MTGTTPATHALLEARGLRKAFDDNVVLAGVDLAVEAGSVVCIVGKSGAGKSVLLKCFAGVMTPDSGEILFEGQRMDHKERAIRAEFRRRCSYLFQHNALLDSLTALENVALPLEQQPGTSRRQFTRQSREMLERLELDEYRDRFPSELSGGMQKRLALARALVTKPQIVLFDEPTAGLDPIRRNSVFSMIARYQRELAFTAIAVTHDVPEALVVSDQVAFLDDDGVIRFSGSPAEFTECDDPAIKAFRDNIDELEMEVAGVRDDTDNRKESE